MTPDAGRARYLLPPWRGKVLDPQERRPLTPLTRCADWRALLCAISAVFTLGAAPAFAGPAQDVLPDPADPGARYLFYLHGRIVEQQGPEAVSPRFGAYAFHDIVAALGARGHHVIAEQRDPGGLDYVERLVRHVDQLMAQGVPAQNIAVVGFSKGGYMTLRAANQLQNAEIRFAILAGCIEGVISGTDRSADGLQGRVLSMVDAADDLAGSCVPFFERNPQIAAPRDVVFRTGAAHGLFYRADPVWLDPLLDWLVEGQSVQGRS